MESTNQFLKPITTRINDAGNLEIGGCDLVELVQKYDTPLYVVDEATLRAVCKDYKEAFKAYPKTNMMFALKSLCTSAISVILSDEGFGFDAVSAGELYSVYKSGANMAKVLFNGNNKSFDELSLAMKLNVGRISVDNFFELSLLNEIAKSYGRKVDILLRITPGLECHTHEYIQTGHPNSKFGFDLSVIDEALDFIVDSNLKLHGLHSHIGSQIFDLSVYSNEIEILIKELVRINNKYSLNLNEINIGGGIGVKYNADDNPPSIYDFAQETIEKLNYCIEKNNIEPPFVFIEPGRSIVSPSGITLYTLGSSKQIPDGKKYFAVDGGMADNPRPSMYQAYYTAEIANKPLENCNETVTIAGRFCESGDILIKNINLPSPEEGDILCVYNTGAYNYSMASNYNGVLKSAMVLVNNSQSDIIVKRETLDDLICHDVVPDRLVKR